MDLKIPKVLARIDMGGYDVALLGRFLVAWVNPTLAVLREHDEIVSPAPSGADAPPPPNPADLEEENRKTFAWYARVFSQGEDPETHWTADELRQVRESDPALWLWMLRSFWDARGEHISKKKRS